MDDDLLLLPLLRLFDDDKDDDDDIQMKRQIAQIGLRVWYIYLALASSFLYYPRIVAGKWWDHERRHGKEELLDLLHPLL